MTSQLTDMTSSPKFFDVLLLLLSRLVTGPSFIPSLVLKLWQFSFIRDWPEIWKSEIPPSGFCQISGNWGELEILHLTHISLMKCYWMLQNAQGYSFYRFWVINPSRPDPGQREKINLNFYFHTSLWCLKRYFMKGFKVFIKPFKAPQRKVKIKN